MLLTTLFLLFWLQYYSDFHNTLFPIHFATLDFDTLNFLVALLFPLCTMYYLPSLPLFSYSFLHTYSFLQPTFPCPLNSFLIFVLTLKIWSLHPKSGPCLTLYTSFPTSHLPSYSNTLLIEFKEFAIFV